MTSDMRQRIADLGREYQDAYIEQFSEDPFRDEIGDWDSDAWAEAQKTLSREGMSVNDDDDVYSEAWDFFQAALFGELSEVPTVDLVPIARELAIRVEEAGVTYTPTNGLGVEVLHGGEWKRADQVTCTIGRPIRICDWEGIRGEELRNEAEIRHEFDTMWSVPAEPLPD